MYFYNDNVLLMLLNVWYLLILIDSVLFIFIWKHSCLSLLCYGIVIILKIWYMVYTGIYKVYNIH